MHLYSHCEPLFGWTESPDDLVHATECVQRQAEKYGLAATCTIPPHTLPLPDLSLLYQQATLLKCLEAACLRSWRVVQEVHLTGKFR
jgi:hypothetical protein